MYQKDCNVGLGLHIHPVVFKLCVVDKTKKDEQKQKTFEFNFLEFEKD